jgi:hypothetical protein
VADVEHPAAKLTPIVPRARTIGWPAQLPKVDPRHGDQALRLVCRPGLDLHTARPLRPDGSKLFSAARWSRAGGPSTGCGLGPNWLPSVGQLGGQYGDRTTLGVHFTGTSVRYLWLERAQRADTPIDGVAPCPPLTA